MDDHTARSVRATIRTLGLVGAVGTLACVALLWVFPTRFALAPTLVLAAALIVALGLLERYAFRFRVREERVAMSFQDTVHVLALLVLTPALAPLVAAAGCALGQALCKRPWIKASFNVAQETMSVSVTALVTAGLLLAGAPLVLAILPAPIVYGLLNHASVARLVGAIERVSATKIFRERMVGWALVGLVFAEATGVAIAMAV